MFTKMTGAVLAVVMLVWGFAGVAAAAPPDAAHEINASGIGAAKLGSTKAQLESQLGTGFTLTPADNVLVDLLGFEVKKGGVTQFYALRSAGTGSKLTLFVTPNADYQTAQEIGPGSLISEGEATYGAATLAYNPDNESREFASFVNGPAGRVSFRTNGGSGPALAGVYAANATSTTTYVEGATVQTVWVSCAEGIDCPTLAITGPSLATGLALAATLLIALGATIQATTTQRRSVTV